jgi:sphinganine-1-phosphate aldolase
VATLADAVAATDGIRLFAPPEITVVCLASAGVDLFALAARGWHTQPQLSYGNLPPTLHLTVTAAIGATAAEFAPHLADAVAAARARGPIDLPPELLGTAAALTPAMVTPALIEGLAQGLGLAGGDFSQMATVNTLLDAAPPALREALLTGFLSLLQRPAW